MPQKLLINVNYPILVKTRAKWQCNQNNKYSQKTFWCQKYVTDFIRYFKSSVKGRVTSNREITTF